MPRDATGQRDPADYTFFYGTNHVNGWASQWYRAPFTATVNIDGVDQEVEFPTTEHWMMLHKALLFSDFDVAREVLSTDGTSKQDMTKVKRLGRKVKNFKEDVWVKNRERIVLEGSLHKFRQNTELKEKLFATGETTIVEASPRDRIWGIGCGQAKAMSGVKFKWGLNLLGRALVKARTVLREEEGEAEGKKADSE
ncbi:DUF1768 domain-containing protein [Mycena sanguinolenta]|uniref:DUF1768 domain-containing protein n=1 Tax=Mycena sanguinolenta TaxID=230812 RepID=A0A8H6XX44_9AGAR|nr:DUF1768 domain-containing protein [Mycena sanguinolenta]